MQVRPRAAYRGRTDDLFITSSISQRLVKSRLVQNHRSEPDSRTPGTAWECRGLSPELSPESEPGHEAALFRGCLPLLDHLYVIGEGNGSGIVKIGRGRNPRKRLHSIQIGNPRRLHLLHVEEGAGSLEFAVHAALSRHRLNGEWFDLGDLDPVAEVRRTLRLIQSYDPLKKPAKRRGGGRQVSLHTIIRMREPDAILTPAEVAHFIMSTNTPIAGELAGRGVPWEFFGADLGCRRRDLELWLKEAARNPGCEPGPSPALLELAARPGPISSTPSERSAI